RAQPSRPSRPSRCSRLSSSESLGVSVVDEAIRAIIEDVNAPALFIPFNYFSSQAEASAVVKTGASYLFGYTVTNSNAAARFIQLFDSDKLPSNGAVPVNSVSCATVADKEMLWIPPGRMDR